MTSVEQILEDIMEQGMIRKLNVIVESKGESSPVRVSATVLRWYTPEVAEIQRSDTGQKGAAFLQPTEDGMDWWWDEIDEGLRAKLETAHYNFVVCSKRVPTMKMLEKAQEQALRDLKDRNEREVLLRMKGEQLFGKIAKELNEFFPEERTRETWIQICVALALAEGK